MSSTPVRELEQELRAVRWLPAPPERRSIRVRSGLSQARVARAVGVTRMAVHHWEAGTRSPRGESVVKYAEVLRALDREAVS